MSPASSPAPSAASHLTFCGLSIAYDHRVLEPRPWTEAQSAWAAELLAEAPAGPVLELCAGVGHIGLGAVRDAGRDLVMVDVNPVAREFALENAAANGLESRVEFRLARIDEALDAGERFPLVIADPPWVRSAETSRFPADPVLAIDGGDDGLDLARTCVDLIDGHLAEGGSALLQLGNTAQADLIAAYAAGRSGGAVTVAETRVFERGVVVRLTR
ncbi:MAG: class I SAM-dependent methyltransferase [Micrococcus sp.]|nr:class I SAM-dependent methyltransferase [Micrococcus sp.]